MDESRKHRKKNPESGAGDGLQRDIIKMAIGIRNDFGTEMHFTTVFYHPKEQFCESN